MAKKEVDWFTLTVDIPKDLFDRMTRYRFSLIKKNRKSKMLEGIIKRDKLIQEAIDEYLEKRDF